jgi:hypothetical protein
MNPEDKATREFEIVNHEIVRRKKGPFILEDA